MVFTLRQNKALRRELRALRNERGLSQVLIGRLLGIAQQSAGTLLTAEAAGFSYESATRLARELGYSGVDEFFRAKGLGVPGAATVTDEQAKSA